MLVKFSFPWFSPTELIVKNKLQSTSGRYYKKGIHDIPDEMKEYLPASVEIIKDRPKPEPIEVETLRDFDTARKDADLVVEKLETAEETLKKQQRARMAHARTVKDAKDK